VPLVSRARCGTHIDFGNALNRRASTNETSTRHEVADEGPEVVGVHRDREGLASEPGGDRGPENALLRRVADNGAVATEYRDEVGHRLRIDRASRDGSAKRYWAL